MVTKNKFSKLKLQKLKGPKRKIEKQKVVGSFFKVQKKVPYMM